MTDYSTVLIDFGYILASMLFIIGIKMLGRPERARQGNMVSALGMLVAVVAALFECCLSFSLVIAGVMAAGMSTLDSSINVSATDMDPGDLARLVDDVILPRLQAVEGGRRVVERRGHQAALTRAGRVRGGCRLSCSTTESGS